jgi:hypothetical protein
VSVSAFLDRFNIGTTGANIVRTGYGHTPKLKLPFYCGRIEAEAAVGRETHQRCQGVSIGPAGDFAITSQSEQAAPSMVTDQGVRDDALLASITIGGAWDGLASTQSDDSDGWTGVKADAFARDIRAALLSLSGTCIEAVETQLISEPTGTGSQTYTPASYNRRTDALFTISIPSGINPPALAGDSRYMVGIACNNNGTIEQGVLAGGSNDAAITSETRHYQNMAEAIAHVLNDHTGINTRASVTAFNANGSVAINWLEVIGDGGRDYLLCFIRGGKHALKQFTTQTDLVTAIQLTGFAGTPAAAMFFSAMDTTFQAQDVIANHDAWSVGAWDGNNQAVHAVYDENAQASADVTTGKEEDDVYLNIQNGVKDGSMAVQSRAASLLEMIMTDADPTQRVGFAWIIAENRRTAFHGDIFGGVLR